MTADLDFSGHTLPLGASSNGKCVAFSGVFQGKGHSIKNLVVGVKNKMIAVGLFCSLKDATVENLVIDSTCSFTGISAGALSASADGSLIVRNTTNKATVTGNQKLGGFIGYVEGLEQPTVISFEDCVNEANVTATRSYVGGFVGSASSNANITFTVSNSANNGNVNGNEQYVGGFVGFINNTIVHMNIFNFTNSGTVSGSRGSVGGFIGSFYKKHIHRNNHFKHHQQWLCHRTI